MCLCHPRHGVSLNSEFSTVLMTFTFFFFVFLFSSLPSVKVVGSQARILYSNEEGRIALATSFNKAVADGRLKVRHACTCMSMHGTGHVQTCCLFLKWQLPAPLWKLVLCYYIVQYVLIDLLYVLHEF